MMQCRILLTRASIAPLFQTTWHLSLHYFISETNEYPAFLIQKSNQKIYQVCVHPKEASEKMDGSRARHYFSQVIQMGAYTYISCEFTLRSIHLQAQCSPKIHVFSMNLIIKNVC